MVVKLTKVQEKCYKAILDRYHEALKYDSWVDMRTAQRADSLYPEAMARKEAEAELEAYRKYGADYEVFHDMLIHRGIMRLVNVKMPTLKALERRGLIRIESIEQRKFCSVCFIRILEGQWTTHLSE